MNEMAMLQQLRLLRPSAALIDHWDVPLSPLFGTTLRFSINRAQSPSSVRLEGLAALNLGQGASPDGARGDGNKNELSGALKDDKIPALVCAGNGHGGRSGAVRIDRVSA